MERMIRKIIMAVAAAVFLFSTAMVVKYHLEVRSGEELAESLNEMVVILPTAPAVPQATEGEYTTEPTEGESPTEPMEQVPIQVDFEGLCGQNPDVIAWIYCPDTPINYPVVQSSDNSYYLRRLLDGRRNTAGTLFMDFRNESDLSDWNSIIYGHNMKNDTMFGTLTDYQSQSYFEAHRVMYLLTPEENYRIDLLAGFVTSAKDALYTAFDPDDVQKAEFLEKWLDASDFDAGFVPDAGCRLVTLSTCSYAFQNARFVIIGVLTAI